MKKYLLSALWAAACMANAYAEGTQILIGDAKDDEHIWIGDGLSYGADANMGVALRIPQRTLQAYAGAKIVGLKIAAADQVDELPIDAFLAKGSLVTKQDGNGKNYKQLELQEPEVSQHGYIGWIQNEYPAYGDWDHMSFDNPYTIPDAKDIKFDLYFGFYMQVKADQRSLGVSAQTQTIGSNKVYLSISEDLDNKKPTDWQDITSIPGIYSNNVAVCAIVELPEEVSANAMSFQGVYTPHVGILDGTVKSYVYLTNDGPTEVNDFEITTTFDGIETVQTYHFPEGEGMPIGYVTGNRNAMPMEVPVLGTGVHSMVITKVNGEENMADPEASKHEYSIVAIPAEEAQKHVRRPVVEQYMAEDDHKSGVYQDDIVLPSLQPYKGKCTYLPQHSNDKFAMNPVTTPAFIGGQETTLTLTDADRLFIGLVGDINTVFMPAQTIDRSLQMNIVSLSGKPQTGAVMPTAYPQAMEFFMGEALYETPTFASVELSNTYYEGTNAITVQASGTVADVLPEGEKARLALYLIEEGIESDSQEFPDDSTIAEKYPDGIFTHARVVRQMITPIEGDELEPGDFEKTYDVEIDNPRWKTNHMKVIALVQRPMTNDRLERNIINSAEEPVTPDYEELEMSSIKNVEASAPARSAIYDLQGRRLSAPTHGINIINGKKILVK